MDFLTLIVYPLEICWIIVRGVCLVPMFFIGILKLLLCNPLIWTYRKIRSVLCTQDPVINEQTGPYQADDIGSNQSEISYQSWSPGETSFHTPVQTTLIMPTEEPV